MDKIRDFMQSWPGRLTMLAITAPMAFWGLSNSLRPPHSPNELVRTPNSVIDLGVFQSELTNYRNQLLQSIDISLINEEALSADILERLVTRALLQNQAHVLGMFVSDEAISQLIAQDTNFHENGQFSNEKFAAFLQHNGLTKDELFNRFRSELSVRQLTTGILGTAIYPSSQVSHLLDLQLEARDIWVHRLKWQDYADQVSVTQAQIDAYYNANKDKLVRPESVDLAYIELSANTIKVDAPTTDEINAQFALYLQQRGMSDGRELSQILLTGNDAEKLANEIKAKLDKGESFEALAKQYSDDPSGQTGGAIGKFNPAVFGNDAHAVSGALSGLGVGQVSKPVKTSFGYQIFKVTKAGDITPQSVHGELVQLATQAKRQAVYNDMIAKINGMATDGMGIADIAVQMKLTAKTLKGYTKENNATVLSQPMVVTAAFDDFTIQDQAVSANITLGDKTVWVQPSNHQQAKALTLAEASEQIKAILIKQKAIELALVDAKQLADKTKTAGVKSLMSQATSLGMTTRQSPRVNDQERASLFLHKADNAVWAVATDEGASVLIGGAVAAQATTQIPPAERARASLMIRDNLGQDQLMDYVQYLKDTTEYNINQDALKR